MPIRICDLHTHSTFSDGTLTPTELVALAKKTGLSAVALTDHNTVSGLPEFLSAGADSGVETVPGVEFSTDYRGTELHVVGLFIKPEHFGRVTEVIDESKRRKEESNLALAEALNAAGFKLDYEEVKAKTSGQVNRAHFAATLKEKGYVSSIEEAFGGLLSKRGGLYREPARPSALEVVKFIKSIGAVAVLAHPFLNLKEEGLREFLSQAQGLDAIETEYSKYTAETTAKAKAIAAEFGLKESGGSDFHGENKPDIRLGVGRGELAVPMEFYERLKTAID